MTRTSQNTGGASLERPASSYRALHLIALFKFAKAVLLVLVAAGALGLVRPTIASRAEHLTLALAAAGNHRFLPEELTHVLGLSPHKLEALGVGAFLYAGLFLVEGVGLWRGQRWGEYLTVIATGSLVPLEVIELVRRWTAIRVFALGLNLVVVVYLIHRLRQKQAGIVTPAIH